MEKLVSVIIPAYNHQKYIKECLESVINQTYQNLEIIIQDDFSTDNTVQEIKKVKDKRIKAVFSKTNQGVVNTINDLLKMCHGEYVAAIGSDDIWQPDKIAKQVEIFKKHPNLGGVFTGVNIIDETDKSCDDNDNIAKTFKNNVINRADVVRKFYKTDNFLCHPSSLISMKAIKKIGPYNEAYRQLHDYDYWTRLINEYDIYIIDEPLTNYRRVQKNNKSISAPSKNNLIRHFNEVQTINSNMIINMHDKLFKEAFQDVFLNPKSHTPIEIFCEKYFVLLKMDCCNEGHNNQFAIQQIFNYPDKAALFKVLKDKYNYSLTDFYQETGLISKLYPASFYNENKALEKQYNLLSEENAILKQQVASLNENFDNIIHSKSWKITQPLRQVSEILNRGGKND